MADKIDDIKLKDVIQFISYNITDPNVYLGTVKGFIDYDIAKTTNLDIEAYHSAVITNLGTTATLPDIKELRYFQLKISNKSELVCFALEWINPATLEILEHQGKLSIDVLDITENETNNIISVLAANGYNVVMKKFDSY